MSVTLIVVPTSSTSITTSDPTRTAAPAASTPGLPLLGRYALITGGGTGIGLACARSFLLDGATVTICGRRKTPLQEAADALRPRAPEGAGVRYVVADVTDEADVEATVAHAVGPTGRLDIAVAAAGRGSVGPLLLTPAPEVTDILTTNVLGVFLTIKYAGAAMVEAGGSITVISSLAATTVHRYMGPYNASKAAADMLVRTAADELGPFGIRVNSVRPGIVDTDIVAIPLADTSVRDSFLRRMPISRIGQPDDIAAAVRFLADPATSWITGACLPVDGGHHISGGPDYGTIARLLYGDAAVGVG